MWAFKNTSAGRMSKTWRLMLTGMLLIGFLAMDLVFVMAEPNLSEEISSGNKKTEENINYARKTLKLLKPSGKPHYEHEWPELRLDWKVVVGSMLGFLGAAVRSIGGVGGGGVFIPMLDLIIGFDPKSSTALSKCMITGTCIATVCYNIRQRHPTLEQPLIDYDLALLFQPMFILGISIGVSFNVIFADWMITVLLIIIFLGNSCVIFADWMITVLLIIIFLGLSTKSFRKGVKTWKNESIKIKEATAQNELNGTVNDAVDVQIENKELGNLKMSLINNIHWKELGLLVFVWMLILALQIAKKYSTTCSVRYWILNLLQVPIGLGVSTYEVVCLYKGRRKIASKGDFVVNCRIHKLLIYLAFGLLAGMLGGILGLGGGFILGPLFLEMGIPPQVSSATTTFAMLFSASISVVEYYLLKRFPVPYALYLASVATIAAFFGQYVVGKLIKLIGRASIIIFILAGMIFGSAITLGIDKMIKMIERKQYMGFDDICSYRR